MTTLGFRKRGARSVRIFGSVLRGMDEPDSDIDILVDTTDKTSAWLTTRLVLDLEDLLGRKIDVIAERGLGPFVRDHVLAEARPV